MPQHQIVQRNNITQAEMLFLQVLTLSKQFEIYFVELHTCSIQRTRCVFQKFLREMLRIMSFIIVENNICTLIYTENNRSLQPCEIFCPEGNCCASINHTQYQKNKQVKIIQIIEGMQHWLIQDDVPVLYVMFLYDLS